MVFSSGAKKEVEKLPAAVQERIATTVKYAKIWSGLVILAAGVLYASKPYLDHLRSQDKQQGIENARTRVKADEE